MEWLHAARTFLEVWREAFRRLGAVDEGGLGFKAMFLEEIQQEVRSEMVWSHQFDSLNKELNSPIVEEEVLRVIANLKLGKAAGIDTMINEILKLEGRASVGRLRDFAKRSFGLKGYL
jgi:hypothetical protein